MQTAHQTLSHRSHAMCWWSFDMSRIMVKAPHSKHFTGHRTKKNLSDLLTKGMQSMYQHNLYGDAARGCHHRGDGPDACTRTISHDRQRLGDLSEEASWRHPWGCRGGRCNRNRP